jgi:hypothetical protein
MGMPQLCSELITVYIQKANGAMRKVVGILEEISATAACLQLEENPGIAARIQFVSLSAPRAPRMECKVTSCRYEPGLGHFAEVSFAPGFRWSPSLFRPAHLLDPERMAAAARPPSLRHQPARGRSYGGARRRTAVEAPATAWRAAP